MFFYKQSQRFVSFAVVLLVSNPPYAPPPLLLPRDSVSAGHSWTCCSAPGMRVTLQRAVENRTTVVFLRSTAAASSNETIKNDFLDSRGRGEPQILCTAMATAFMLINWSHGERLQHEGALYIDGDQFYLSVKYPPRTAVVGGMCTVVRVSL